MSGRMFLAAGHYPAEPGAGFEGFFEHDEADRWLALVASAMPSHNVEFVPTGTLSTKTRWINARAQPGDFAVELHFNSYEGNPMIDDRGPNGCVVLYQPGSTRGKRLAEIMLAHLAGVFPPARGVDEGWYRGDQSRGTYWFLAKTVCPAVILEPEFINHRTLIQSSRSAGCAAILSAANEFAAIKEVIR